MRRRAGAKRNYPVIVAPAEGSRPEFFWWGLTARMGEFTVLGGDPQIKFHVQSIAEAVARGNRLARERFMVALTAGSLLAALGSFGLTLADMAHTIDDLQDGRELVRRAPEVMQTRASLLDAALRSRAGATFSVTARQQALAAAEEDALRLGLVASVLPLLVAVEDAQFLDPMTIWLLRNLSHQSAATGMVVLTVDTDQAVGGLAESQGDVLGDWLSAEDQAQRLGRFRLEPLNADEMTEIAVAELGNDLDAEMLARVVRHAAGVPGVLYDLLEAPAVSQALSQGGVGPVDLAAIPELSGVRAALAAAPAPVRRVLVIASVHGRMTVREWLRYPGPLPTAADFAAGNDGDIPAWTVNAAISAGWLRERPGASVIEFASPHVLDAVRAARDSELTPEEVRAILRALEAAVEDAHGDRTWEDVDHDVRESLLTSLVEEDPDHLREEIPAALAAELLTLRLASGRSAATSQFLQAITQRLDSGQAYSHVLTVATAEALFDTGLREKALALLSSDYARIRDRHGENDPRTFPALHSLAAAYAAAAQAVHGRRESEPLYKAALALYEQLLNGRIKTLPANRRNVILTRDQYSQVLASCYQYSEAITQGEILLGEQSASQGPYHPDTLTTRVNLAKWRGEAGDPVGAFSAYSELLADALQLHDRHDPLMLRIRNNQAHWQGRTGDVAGAAREFELLLADRLLVLGPDHPDTLDTRKNLASSRVQAGDLPGAAAACEQLLEDQIRLRGPDHPQTLGTRSILATIQGRMGDPAAAARAYEQLLAERTRVLGPDDPDTMTARENLAGWRGTAGDAGGAIAAYEDLLADRTRVLGPDHPHTLITRGYLAQWRGTAGDSAGAVAAFRQLVADERRVLGPDHPYVLAARGNLADWLGYSGKPAAAVSAHEQLLTDMLRILGPSHPDVVIVRNNLAHWRGQAQRGGRRKRLWATEG